jgi:hypothetical protein
MESQLYLALWFTDVILYQWMSLCLFGFNPGDHIWWAIQ